MSFPPPLGGQAPLLVPEGGAEPSGEEASPVRAAPAPALGPKPAPEPAATTALGYPPPPADAQAHARASALSLSVSGSMLQVAYSVAHSSVPLLVCLAEGLVSDVLEETKIRLKLGHRGRPSPAPFP